MIRIPEYLERRRALGLADAASGNGTRRRERRARAGRRPVADRSSPVADAPLTVLFAPDSFKGSLTSVEVARALADGWARARPRRRARCSRRSPTAARARSSRSRRPAAGTVETARVHDPLGATIPARWLRSADGRSAVVEMAEASGLSRVRPGGARPDRGDVARDRRADPGRRIDAGVARIIARDRRQRDDRRRRGLLAGLAGIGDDGDRDGRVDLDAIREVAQTIDVEVACDVTNPLLGPTGAAATYGPQKGATPAQVDELDGGSAGWARRARAREHGPRRARDAGRRRRGRRRASALLCRPRTASGRSPSGPASSSSWRRPTSTASSPTPTSSSPARAGSTPRPRSARPRSASPGAAAAAGVPCIAVGGGVEPEGIDALAPARRRRRPGRRAAADRSRRRWPPARRPSSAAANGSPASCRIMAERSTELTRRRPAAGRLRSPKPRKRREAGSDRRLGAAPRPLPAGPRRRSRSTSSPASTATPIWERRLDPTSELILTILTQNSADIERRGRVRARSARRTRRGFRRSITTRARAGAARGLPDGAPPDWTRGRDRAARGADRRHPARRARHPEGAADPGDAPPDPRGARRPLARVPRRHDRRSRRATG